MPLHSETMTDEQREKFDYQHPSSTFIAVRLGGNPEDFEIRKAIMTYLAIHGVTAKRAFLVGIGEFINKNGDNPALVMDIANYIVEDAKRAVKKQLRTKKGQKRRKSTEYYRTVTKIKADPALRDIDERSIIESIQQSQAGAEPTDSGLQHDFTV